MTREDALSLGLGHVLAVSEGLPRNHLGTAPERAAAAVLVAEFLVRDGQPEAGAEPTAADPDDYTPAGPTRVLDCDVEPGDRLFVRGAKPPSGTLGRPLVGIEATSSSGAVVQVVVSPARARSWAAGILDAADEADGTTPLNFASGGVS